MFNGYLTSDDEKFVDVITDELDKYNLSNDLSFILLFPTLSPRHRLLLHQLRDKNYPNLFSFSVGEERNTRRTIICFKSQLMEETNPRASSLDNKTASPKPVSSTTTDQLNGESSTKRRPAQALYQPPRRSKNPENSSPVPVPSPPPPPPSPPITITASAPTTVPTTAAETTVATKAVETTATTTAVETTFATTTAETTAATTAAETTVATTAATTAAETTVTTTAATTAAETTVTTTPKTTVAAVEDAQQNSNTTKSIKSKTTRPSAEPYVPPSRRSQTLNKEPPSSASSSVSSTNETKKEANEQEEEEEEEWEKLLDSNDNSISKNFVGEIQTKFKENLQIKKPTNDYSQWSVDDIQIKEADLAHVVEVSNFPSTFRTEDLATAFKALTRSDFEIKWVDETHALIVFPDANTALDALQMEHPMYKVCSMSQASSASKKKAKSALEYLQPYKARPQTTSLTANRRICAALGLKNPMSNDKTKTERQKIETARQQKLRDKEEQKSVWEGGAIPSTSTT